jgi:hypothetical protein
MLNEFFGCPFFRHPRKTLDFARPAAPRRRSINKVIHKLRRFLVNRFEISDLGGVSEPGVNTIG